MRSGLEVQTDVPSARRHAGATQTTHVMPSQPVWHTLCQPGQYSGISPPVNIVLDYLVSYDYMVTSMNSKAKTAQQGRSQRRAKTTRKRLKAAALDAFSEKSIDAVTVEEITDKADLGKGTLYQHFDDKEEIVVTLVEEALDHLVERMRSYDCPPETLEGMLEHLLNVHYEFSTESREEFLLLFQGKLLLKLQSETLDELEEPYIRYLKEIEDQLSIYLSPRIDPLKVRRLACAVAGFVFGFFSFAMIGMDEEELENSISPLRKVFVKSLCSFLGR